MALARTYLRDDEPETASRVLPDWAEDDAGEPSLGLRLETGLIEALATRNMGDHRRAAQTVEHVLRLAEPEGFRMLFTHGGASVRQLLGEHLDSGTAYWSFVTELIGASNERSSPENAPVPVLSEPLTDRELTLIRYLQGLLSNEEIAAELYVSVNTVKTHLRHIYRKLDATCRREAVRKARQLHLL